jgi:hypothetical protein
VKLAEILKEKQFQFPLQRDPHQQIKIFLNQTLDSYLHEIHFSQDLTTSYNISEFGYSHNSYKSRINEVVGYLKASLEHYFKGQTSSAYFIFKDIMEKVGIVNLIKTHTYPDMSAFYRIRKFEGSYSLNPMDMFHIPFQSLEKISSQRFSIIGYPSL